MYNLVSPRHALLGDFDEVTQHRTTAARQRLEMIRPQVARSHQQYRASSAHRAQLARLAFNSADGQLLRGNFRKMDKGAVCSHIRSEILATSDCGKCPYCRLGEATTLDHILEKDDFPEFSIFRDNIAPVCSRCNTLKETNRRSIVGRETLHLYYQGFPTQPFIVSRPYIKSANVEFTFALTQPSGIDADWWDAVSAHFERLDLATRYMRGAQSEMQDRLLDLQQVRHARGPDGVRQFLIRNARAVAFHWSAQDWVVALLKGAADDPDFCDWGVGRL